MFRNDLDRLNSASLLISGCAAFPLRSIPSGYEPIGWATGSGGGTAGGAPSSSGGGGYDPLSGGMNPSDWYEIRAEKYGDGDAARLLSATSGSEPYK